LRNPAEGVVFYPLPKPMLTLVSCRVYREQLVRISVSLRWLNDDLLGSKRRWRWRSSCLLEIFMLCVLLGSVERIGDFCNPNPVQ